MRLLIIALAPVFIIALYIYFRDKYEKEPLGLLIVSLLVGSILPLPVIIAGKLLSNILPDNMPGGWPAFYEAFILAGFNEELFKYLALLLLIWRNRNFNEKFDGIVYAVFISLGFAGIENIMYVFGHGATTGYIRALVSVPAHALFGVTMGFYFGLAKFYPQGRNAMLLKAFLYPVLLHGFFDFILMLGNYRLMVLFVPYVIFLYVFGLQKMKNLSNRSVYKL
ncbi:MAG: PrsW family intramembrane metalloprotease [Bacteroidales bacterium]|nr:PrsW family intramembrane metalloprotease [Bacteroidales bacterium]